MSELNNLDQVEGEVTRAKLEEKVHYLEQQLARVPRVVPGPGDTAAAAAHTAEVAAMRADMEQLLSHRGELRHIKQTILQLQQRRDT